MRVGLAIALLCIVAACMPAPAPSRRPTSSSPSAGRSTDLASASPRRRLHGSRRGRRPTTPAAVVNRSPLPFCGVEQGAGPAVTVNAEVRGCFLGAYRDGTGAEYASIQMTIEGDPIATIMRTLSGGGVELLIDSTQDQYGEAQLAADHLSHQWSSIRASVFGAGRLRRGHAHPVGLTNAVTHQWPADSGPRGGEGHARSIRCS